MSLPACYIDLKNLAFLFSLVWLTVESFQNTFLWYLLLHVYVLQLFCIILNTRKAEREFSSVKKERDLKRSRRLELSKKERLEKTIPTLKGKTHNFLSLTAAARYNEFILSEQLRTHVKCRAALRTIANLPTRVHKGHRYQRVVERWEVLQMSEQVLE